MAKSGLVAALDAVTPKTGGRQPIIDTWPDDVREAIVRARKRGVSHREISRVLRTEGYEISEGAVRSWLERHA